MIPRGYDIVWAVIVSPRTFFVSADRRFVFRSVLGTFTVLLCVSTLLLFLAALVNLAALRQANIAMQNYVPGFDATDFQNTAPWNRLAIPVLWFTIVFASGFIRHLAVVVFGESNRRIALTQAVGICAFLPALCAFSLSALLSTFFPIVPGPAGASSGMRFSVWVGLVSVLAAIVLDARISVAGFKTFYLQNTGRAVITWLAPIVLGLVSCSSLYLLIFMLVAITGAGR